MRGSSAQAVDEMLDPILRGYRTGNGRDDGSQYDDMCGEPSAQIAQHEWKRTMRIA
jgi:hypothetical protein